MKLKPELSYENQKLILRFSIMSISPTQIAHKLQNEEPVRLSDSDVSSLQALFETNKENNPLSTPMKKMHEEPVDGCYQRKNCQISDKQTLSTDVQTSNRAFVEHSNLQKIPLQRQEENKRVSSFLQQNQPKEKPKCNWQIYGSYKQSILNKNRMNMATNRVQIAQCKENTIIQNKARSQVSQQPRKWFTLNFEEQQQLNLFRKAVQGESTHVLTKKGLDSFSELLKRQTTDIDLSFLKANKIPLLNNCHPFCPTFRIFKDNQTKQNRQPVSQIKIFEVSQPKKVEKTEAIETKFCLTKRHLKLIEEANKLQIQENNRCHLNMKKNAFFKLRCFSNMKNPIAICLRLSKFTYNQQKRDKEEEQREQSSQRQKVLQGLKEDLGQDKVKDIQKDDEPFFEFQVLDDIDKFQDLLDFFFEKRVLIYSKDKSNWKEYYFPRNAGITQKLELLQNSCQSSSDQLIQIKKKLKLIGNSNVIERLVNYSCKVKNQIYNVKKYAPTVSLGHYMGDKLIDVGKIQKFKVLLNKKLYIINLPKRKKEEKDWVDVIKGYNLRLVALNQTLQKLQQLCLNLKTFATKTLLGKCLFFLQEILCDSQLLDACLSISEKNYEVKPTIYVPDLQQHIAHIAFNKIMKLDDLSKFTIVTQSQDILIQVNKKRIKKFITKLDLLKKIGRNRMTCLPKVNKNKRDQKSQLKEKLELVWVKDEDDFEPLTCMNKGKKDLRKKRVNQAFINDDEDNLIILKSLKMVPRQSSIDYLMFKDKSE